MRHTLSVLVENKFGVLTRISGLFSGRGFNIDTLNVAPTQDPTQSRMTIVVKGDDTVLEQVTKQLNKLVDIIKVQDFRDGEYVDRELVLVKLGADTKSRPEVMQICDIFRAKKVLGRVACQRGNVPAPMMTTGTPDEVDACCRKLIETVGRDGGFILDGAIGIPDEARTDNVRAMFEAAKRYAP